MKTILQQVEEIRRQYAGEAVKEVRVEVGPLVGVEPLLLEAAFRQLAPHSAAAGATMIIDESPLVAVCRACGRAFEVQDFAFHCPSCGAGARIIRGDELRLVSVTLHECDSLKERV